MSQGYYKDNARTIRIEDACAEQGVGIVMEHLTWRKKHSHENRSPAFEGVEMHLPFS